MKTEIIKGWIPKRENSLRQRKDGRCTYIELNSNIVKTQEELKGLYIPKELEPIEIIIKRGK